ncbi:HdeD family acid-resistance protein [Paracoccus sp. (in: a-proteobacteria)]|uniref:HdeD family acid-resistance protein n=1 Tax=Paracoccus sp. TaxID=267 RepID=UPI003A8939D2
MSGRIMWIVIGALSILAGILALANPLAATLTAEQLAGWAFLIVGALQAYAVFRGQVWGGRVWAILLAVALILLGVMLLARPLVGIVTLTLVVASMFFVSGVVKIVLSFSLRGTGAFWMLLLSGALSVLLALMIFGNFPASAATILGILLAVELISDGVSMIALSGTRAADD